jgi:hypothetical protein
MAAYIEKALAKYQPIFKPKSPRLLSQGWFCYWDDTPVDTAASA